MQPRYQIRTAQRARFRVAGVPDKYFRRNLLLSRVFRHHKREQSSTKVSCSGGSSPAPETANPWEALSYAYM